VAGLVAVVLVSAGVVASFPARQILGQRQAPAAAEGHLSALDGDISRLQTRVASLHQPDEIKRLAREKLDLVEPGQESYRVVFPPAGPVPLPHGWPFLLPQSNP
jgi:cell division protein FtsL